MTEKIKQTIKEEVAKLPKETQDAINAFDWAKTIEEIGAKYSLDDSRIGNLQIETLLILAGFEEGNSYALNVETNVETTKEESEKIMQEVSQKIFTPIYNVLTENIKKNLSTKKPAPEQTLNFILSGGDYSTLIEPAAPSEAGAQQTAPDTSLTKINTPSLTDIQANAQKLNATSSRIEDIKTKFTYN